MILLTSTSDKLQVVSSAASDTDVHASWVDLTVSGGAVSAGRQNSAITSATTTDVVPAPASGDRRTVKTLHIRNKHATAAQTVTVQHTDGTTAVELIQIILLAGYVLHYDEGAGFEVQDNYGRTLQNFSTNGSGAAVNALNLVVLSSDVVNANGTANTMADVTGLSFSVTAGETYFFRATIAYTAAVTTNGSRFSVSGPASPTMLSYRTQVAANTTTDTIGNGQTAYDLPVSTSLASAGTAGNIAIVTGLITPSSTGTVIMRFASEQASSAITAKAGSVLEWVRVI